MTGDANDMQFLGVNWVGINAENGKKVLLSLAFIAVVLVASAILRVIVGLVIFRSHRVNDPQSVAAARPGQAEADATGANLSE